MPTKLKFYMDKKGNKIYTLKDKVDNSPTIPAHYKFVKIPDLKKSK